MDIKIVKAKTLEDCKICSKYMSKLINYEAKFDSTIISNVQVNGLFEKNLQDEDFYFAYAKQKNPIGFIFGYLQNPKGKIRNTNIIALEGLYVDMEHRNSGVGKQLIQAFENWANEKYKGDFKIEITYISTNKEAGKFYSKMGYSLQKEILRK